MSERGTFAAGEVFAGYTIEAVLGGGGMGTVYLAAHPRLPLRVALKLLHPELTRDDYVRSRFESEADHAARLEHPNIVTVYDRGREGDQLWIAMQYVTGTDAGKALAEGALDPARAVHIVTEIAKALDYAHGAGVLHRDVKPGNILLEQDRPDRPRRVLLVDFGIAKALDETRHLTKSGMLVASLQYAAPEQFEGTALDQRADVYSLGCTLFHLLTGQPPYPGTSLPQLMHGHLNMPIPRPSRVRPGLSPAFDAVIASAMAKDREDRYSSCGALAADARRALGIRVDNHASTVIDDLPETVRNRPPRPVREQLAPKPASPQRSTVLPVMVTLLVVAVLALGGVVGWLVLDKNRTDTSATATTSREQPTSETGPAPTSPPTTTPVPTTPPPITTTTVVAIPPSPLLVGGVSGADAQGFLTPAAARCKSTNPAVFIGRTPQSLVVVCQTGVGRYYYQGVRLSDGAGISLDDPTPNGSGFVVTNPADGTSYHIDPAALTIVDRNGHILAAEPMLESAHR